MNLIKRNLLGNKRHLRAPKSLIDFASNDYLGLARSKKLADTIQLETASLRQLNGSTGSRLLTGNSLYAEKLEESIAFFHQAEACLLFNCGYMANMGLISTIEEQDLIFFDASIHASMRVALRLSRAKAYPFKHNDMDHLMKRLQRQECRGRRYICIESIYSTDGLKAPLNEIAALAVHYQALLIVDEAHAVGLYGPQGKGLIVEHALQSSTFARVVTFGKGLGIFGAAVLGSQSLKQHLINFAPSFIYTTALPFTILSAIKCSYALLPELDKERAHLQDLIQLMAYSKTQIQSVNIKGNHRVSQAAVSLAKLGYDVRPLMSPTIRRGSECLRICLHAFNSKEEVLGLLKSLSKVNYA